MHRSLPIVPDPAPRSETKAREREKAEIITSDFSLNPIHQDTRKSNTRSEMAQLTRDPKAAAKFKHEVTEVCEEGNDSDNMDIDIDPDMGAPTQFQTSPIFKTCTEPRADQQLQYLKDQWADWICSLPDSVLQEMSELWKKLYQQMPPFQGLPLIQVLMPLGMQDLPEQRMSPLFAVQWGERVARDTAKASLEQCQQAHKQAILMTKQARAEGGDRFRYDQIKIWADEWVDLWAELEKRIPMFLDRHQLSTTERDKNVRERKREQIHSAIKKKMALLNAVSLDSSIKASEEWDEVHRERAREEIWEEIKKGIQDVRLDGPPPGINRAIAGKEKRLERIRLIIWKDAFEFDWDHARVLAKLPANLSIKKLRQEIENEHKNRMYEGEFDVELLNEFPPWGDRFEDWLKKEEFRAQEQFWGEAGKKMGPVSERPKSTPDSLKKEKKRTKGRVALIKKQLQDARAQTEQDEVAQQEEDVWNREMAEMERQIIEDKPGEEPTKGPRTKVKRKTAKARPNKKGTATKAKVAKRVQPKRNARKQVEYEE
ncbi:MAG: hypothetical protein MMC33_001507 [Icmadophila ericetorum]|nr:hypothetical protein [Icmadophila ericetorum]